MSIFAARNRTCGEICLLATTLKNAKIIYDICVFVTAPHVMWGLFYAYLPQDHHPEPQDRHPEPQEHDPAPGCHPDPPGCHPERSEGSLTRLLKQKHI